MLHRNELLFSNACLNSITLAPEDQREIFTRLMDLNQKIAAEEAAHGLTLEINPEEEELENE